MDRTAFPLFLVCALAATACGTSARQPTGIGFHVPPADEGRRVEARSAVVTSASGLASDVGLAILRAGGNAVDAAVATAFALGVVEPQMSGLGGSGAAMVWMQRERRPTYLDFYAAQLADSWRGSPALTQAAGSGPGAPPDLRGVGIPGSVAGLLQLHERLGTLSREQVLAPAIRLAADGFPVGKILADFIAGGEAKLKPYPAAMALYFPGGKPLPPGAVLKNPELAQSLRRIAQEGRAGFYAGPVAAAMLASLNAGQHPATLRDFSEYEPQLKVPLCTDYRGHTVLSAPPPQTGFRVLHTLELLERFDLRTLGVPTRSAAAFDVLTSALRVGQAGGRGNGDPNWMSVPARGIASAEFAATRRPLVGTGRAAPIVPQADAADFESVPPPARCAPFGGRPAAPVEARGALDPAGEADLSPEGAGETTHLSVVDAAGNAVALTVTNSSVWGSGAFVGGFFLNDSGFRFTAENLDQPARSRWRIRTTTIAPTIVLRDDRVEMVIGAPGAGRIPTEIVQVMVYTLDYRMDPLDAVRMPRIFASAANPRVQIEHGFSPELLAAVREMGYDPVAESSGYARLYMIVRRGDTWIGVADTRHDGQPRGY